MNSAIRDLWIELHSDVRAAKVVPALSAGLTSGLSLLCAQVAFGTFIASGGGALAPYSSQMIGLILFGNFATCLLIGLAGSFRGTIAGLSPALVIVMATIAASVNASEDAILVTVYCALALSAVATGACCLLIGFFRLAVLMRFIPYPVAAGFVSGLGGIVCVAAMSSMAADADLRDASSLLNPAVAGVWIPGAIYGVALYIATRRWGNPLILPASVVALILGYSLALNLVGLTTAEAGGLGILLVNTAGGGLWPAISSTELLLVDWSAIASQVPNMLTLVLIAFVCVVMNIAGLELAVDQELDWDREFRATGSASIISGLGGGTVATIVVPASLRSKLLGANTRLTSIVTAVVVGTALFLGGGMLNFVPTALIGGILLFAGLGLLEQGFRGLRKGLPRAEFGIVILIFVTMNVFGMVEGVGVGILAALVFFAVRLSRVDPVETSFSLRDNKSSKARPVPDLAILQEDGKRALGYRLRGYIFFGSVGPLTERLKESLAGPRRLKCLLLDFSAVTGFDFSAVSSLSRFLRLASEKSISVVLSGASPRLMSAMERNLPASAFAELISEANLDCALERCEDIIVSAWNEKAAVRDDRRTALLAKVADGLERHLDQQVRLELLIEELGNWLVPCDYSAGDAMATNSPSEGIEILADGLATARDVDGKRLRQFGAGDVILGNAGLGMPRASVIAEGPCRTVVLSPTAQRVLEAQDSKLALKLYRYLVSTHFDLSCDHASQAT